MLTTYTSDSRDVIEVRKSERELALRINALEKAQQVGAALPGGGRTGSLQQALLGCYARADSLSRLSSRFTKMLFEPLCTKPLLRPCPVACMM